MRKVTVLKKTDWLY